MAILEGKKVLFISVKFFGIEKEIIKALLEEGAQVDYFDERPSNNSVAKAIIRFKKELYNKKIRKYYNHIIKKISFTNYDYFFVNKGEAIPVFFLEEFIKLNPNSIRIYYNWDSFNNNKYALKNLDYFNYKYSFDPYDCEKYNLKFRPLFFVDSFQEIMNIDKKPKYDLLSISTAHTDRYLRTKEIVNWCKERGLQTHTFFYMQAKWYFLFRKIFDENFKKVLFKDLSFKGLDLRQIKELYSESNVILDINHDKQKGLTIRTFEAIGAHKKLITTNNEILKYQFYDSNNILIIDRDNPNLKLKENFFNSDYKPLDDKMYDSLSINGWLKTLFSKEYENEWYMTKNANKIKV